MKDISQGDIENNLKLITRKDFKRDIKIGEYQYKDDEIVIMAGPCTVEGRQQIHDIAKAVKECGGTALRGGVFKPLTFPYGDPLGKKDSDPDAKGEDLPRDYLLSKKEMFDRAEKRFGYLKEAGEKYGLPVISEVTLAQTIPMMEKYVDMFQVGYRHMFNMDLICALAESSKPILLKRHYGESIRSWLGVGEHFDARGKQDFMFCERGVSIPHTHNVESRAVLDVQVIPALNDYAPSVPVIIDPSHATFKRSYVHAVTTAGIAAGANGVLIEIHTDPENAWVDPLQALNFKAFEKLVKDIDTIARISKRRVASGLTPVES